MYVYTIITLSFSACQLVVVLSFVRYCFSLCYFWPAVKHVPRRDSSFPWWTWVIGLKCVCCYQDIHNMYVVIRSPVWARGRCTISPPRFLAECCKRQLNQASYVLLYFRLFTFSDLYWVYLYFPVLFCLSVAVKWLAVKTASEMTYTVSSAALNSTPSIHVIRTVQ